jgi:hypothetical protein
MGRLCRVPPIAVAAGAKYCFQCATAKPVEHFAMDNKAWDRLRSMCRSCDAGRFQAYHARKVGKSVPDRIAQSRRNWQGIKACVEAAKAVAN